MIISYRYKMAFLHCRKTAGSSVTSYLNRYLGPDDLQLGNWREALEAGGRYNRRFYRDIMRHNGGMELLRETVSRAVRLQKPNVIALQQQVYRQHFADFVHPSATDVKNFMGEDFDHFWKFCFVRNPYDRIVSDYKWRLRKRGFESPVISLNEYLLRLEDRERPDPEKLRPKTPDNRQIYMIGDKLMADFVGRYENLMADMAQICGHLGLPFDETGFPHCKNGHNAPASYRDYYGPKEKRRVEKMFGLELDLFEYRF